ncbi:hypothetical protein DMUE_5326 [Dictyocoela muelleri]|nr:hypothetical protein DMUE_5326 [Dictyocoela muelleri]
MIEQNTNTDEVAKPRKERKEITKGIIEIFKNLISDEKKPKEICVILNISKSTYKRLVKRYINGDFNDLSRLSTSDDKRRSRKKNIIAEKNAITMSLELNPCLTIKELAINLETNHNIVRSVSTIHRIVKSAGFSRKVLTKIPINRNSDQNKTLRYIFGQSIENIPNDKIIYIDESGFNLHLAQNYGYSKKNTKASISVPNSKGQNVSFLCAISINGIYSYKIKKGSFNSTDMCSFINNDLPSLRENEIKYIIMDNASIHKTSEVAIAANSKRYILKFLPPYSPQLNPIEEFFSTFKSRYCLRPRPKNFAEIFSNIEYLVNHESFKMNGYFEHMRQYITKCLSREDFI